MVPWAFAGWQPVFAGGASKALLIGVYLVEFVDVNQKKAAKAALRFLLALEVDTVGVAETQFRGNGIRQKVLLSNLADLPSRGEVLLPMLFVDSPPMCHHAKKPPVEQFPPIGDCGGHGSANARMRSLPSQRPVL